MRRTTQRLVAGLLLAVGQLVSAAALHASEDGTGVAPPIITATRQNAFTIPFRIEPPQTPAEQPVEAQLHVSTNDGATWELATKVKPEKGSFVYRAPHDGEYWFSIRTIDKQGTARPDGALQAQLKVTVDTVAPRLDLSAARGSAGELIARWQSADPHLKLGSFKLEYQVGGSGPWEQVAVDAPPGAMRHTFSAETTWWPKSTAASIQVRAEISDLAGNKTSTQAVVKASDVAPPRDNLGATPNDTYRPNDPPRYDSVAPADTAPPTNTPLGNAPPSTGNWPAERSNSEPWTRNSNPERPGDAAPSTRDRTPAYPVSQSPSPRGGPLDFSMLPRGERPKMLNSAAFELEYEIDSVGSSGIGKVELWGTRDGGKSWSVFGVDSDQRSPIPARVEAEGIYGFRVVVHSGSGLVGHVPTAGDRPDIWIGIDLTRPLGRIVSADVNSTTNELTIRWEASDDVLDPRPIALLFSANPAGPWTPLASGLENSGSYRWRLDSRLPDPLYLRIEVRDEAGNVGFAETPEPISLDRHRPEGRIRGLRPSSN